MSAVFYTMNMDREVTGDTGMVMDSRDVLASFDKWAEESDSEMSLGGDDKENEDVDEDTPQSQPRPRKRTTRQPLSTSTKYRLGPRRKLAEKDVDFEIYRDETAHDNPPWRRDYYGSNLPALGEIYNEVKFKYAVNHHVRRHHRTLIADAEEAGDEQLADQLWNITVEQPCNLERLSAAYVWDVDCDPLDTWLWVQDKGYHCNWTERQRQRFVEFLEWVKPIMERGIVVAATDRAEAAHVDEWNNKIISLQFQSLDLSNLDLVKESMAKLVLVPIGEDENILHRADFAESEQALIDDMWDGPGRWAPGEEKVPPLESDFSGEESEEESEEDEEPYEIEPAFEGDDLIAF
ncbi:uncharacterized protein Triagg1_10516 [Trichoderma aggressivum f. europaeum]|uniref:Uncharacterized protein n=1 Tax=Trichoderma aggressivum f. europaeum TaxID=173218 RepID=A0AAE1I5Q7_9HYPO|nr:hypothetical protein Triagg1_10516 [Trichoderma aggressivum f. europaeum]